MLSLKIMNDIIKSIDILRWNALKIQYLYPKSINFFYFFSQKYRKKTKEDIHCRQWTTTLLETTWGLIGAKAVVNMLAAEKTLLVISKPNISITFIIVNIVDLPSILGMDFSDISTSNINSPAWALMKLWNGTRNNDI